MDLSFPDGLFFNGSHLKAGGVGDLNSLRNSDHSLVLARAEMNSNLQKSKQSEKLWTDLMMCDIVMMMMITKALPVFSYPFIL